MMAGIQPISGVSAQIQPATAPAAGQQGKSPEKAGFSDVRREYVDHVDQDQKQYDGNEYEEVGIEALDRRVFLARSDIVHTLLHRAPHALRPRRAPLHG